MGLFSQWVAISLMFSAASDATWLQRVSGSTVDVSATAAVETVVVAAVAVGGGARGDRAMALAPTSAMPAVVNGCNESCMDFLCCGMATLTSDETN
ncbi:hypothetical protein A5666_01635 [Mycolicibacterium fortuitum]|nr:hypothetical protein A5665_12035 [Mycolicibacterium fortuitum]OBI69393.1 hypothetical protein A5666_01635 [Mycolicibacterium fortuitum]